MVKVCGLACDCSTSVAVSAPRIYQPAYGIFFSLAIMASPAFISSLRAQLAGRPLWSEESEKIEAAEESVILRLRGGGGASKHEEEGDDDSPAVGESVSMVGIIKKDSRRRRSVPADHKPDRLRRLQSGFQRRSFAFAMLPAGDVPAQPFTSASFVRAGISKLATPRLVAELIGINKMLKPAFGTVLHPVGHNMTNKTVAVKPPSRHALLKHHLIFGKREPGDPLVKPRASKTRLTRIWGTKRRKTLPSVISYGIPTDIDFLDSWAVSKTEKTTNTEKTPKTEELYVTASDDDDGDDDDEDVHQHDDGNEDDYDHDDVITMIMLMMMMMMVMIIVMMITMEC